MSITFDPALAHGLATQLRDALAAGAGQPTIEIYADPAPAYITDTPAAVLLARIVLQTPPAPVGGRVAMTQVGVASGLATGSPTWARWCDGDGEPVLITTSEVSFPAISESGAVWIGDDLAFAF